jgi:hypothetical protein
MTDIAANDPGLLIPFGTSLSWTIQLTGADQQPVSGATVYLYGTGVPAQGRTDATGSVTLQLTNESDATLRALYVNPLSGYWSLWVNRPTLTSGSVNTVPLQPLTSSFGGFPATELLGWGQPGDAIGPGTAHHDRSGGQSGGCRLRRRLAHP